MNTGGIKQKCLAYLFNFHCIFLFSLQLFSTMSRGERHSLEKLHASTRTPLFPHGHELTLIPVVPGKPLMPGEPAGPGYPFRPVSPFAPMSPFTPATQLGCPGDPGVPVFPGTPGIPLLPTGKKEEKQKRRKLLKLRKAKMQLHVRSFQNMSP